MRTTSTRALGAATVLVALGAWTQATLAQSRPVGCDVTVTRKLNGGHMGGPTTTWFYRNTCSMQATVRWSWDNGVHRADFLDPGETSSATCYHDSQGCTKGFAYSVRFTPARPGSAASPQPTVQDVNRVLDRAHRRAYRTVYGDPVDPDTPDPVPDITLIDPDDIDPDGRWGGVSVAVDPSRSRSGSLKRGAAKSILDLADR